MAVADRIPVTRRGDRDGRQDRAALLGQPDGDPAPPGSRGGRNSLSNWTARWDSTVPVIASSRISRTPLVPCPRRPRSRWTASRAHSAQRRRRRRNRDARRRARTALTNARSASAASHPIAPSWSMPATIPIASGRRDTDSRPDAGGHHRPGGTDCLPNTKRVLEHEASPPRSLGFPLRVFTRAAAVPCPTALSRRRSAPGGAGWPHRDRRGSRRLPAGRAAS